MKTGLMGGIGLAILLLTGPLARGQGAQPEPRRDNPLRAIELRHKQLDIDQRQHEIAFNEQMRQLELEKKRMELEQERAMLKTHEQKPAPRPGIAGPGAFPGKDGYKKCHFMMKHFFGFVFMCMIVHVLLAIWVYQDIRKRNAGSGIWIVVALLTGLPGALVYAVVRMGDARREA